MKSKKLSSISIFFPCYNDENTINKLVIDAYRVGNKVARKVEVIVVDDGSIDSSFKLLKKAKIKYPKLIIVSHKKNRGYGGALKSGFKKAKNDFVFYTDGDGQYKVDDLVKLANGMSDKVDVVNGKKKVRDDLFLRKWIGEIYYQWVRFLFKTPIREIDTDFRLIRRSFLKDINLYYESGAICVELISKLARKGARFKEVLVGHYDRKYGRSQFFTISRIVKTLFDDLRLWRDFNFSKKDKK